MTFCADAQSASQRSHLTLGHRRLVIAGGAADCAHPARGVDGGVQ
jgi:hypothetical protein